MHTINTFLFGEIGDTSREKIFALVRDYFKDDTRFVFDLKEMPFGLPSQLRVSFESYSFDVSYIDDPSIHESVKYIERVVNKELSNKKEILCEIRTMFGVDKELIYDHIVVSMYQFLEGLKGAVVYDDNHKKIIASAI